MPSHETKTVQVRNVQAEIDVDIAPLIEEIWKAGIQTTNSCQENQPGVSWIEFLTAFDAVDFLNAVAGEFDDDIDSLYNRIRGEWEPNDGRAIEWWQFGVHPWDASVTQALVGDGEIDEDADRPRDFVFSISVRFPRTDLDLVTSHMQSFNESKVGRNFVEHRLGL